MAKGYIYIMTNPCLKGMVKIGYARNVEARRFEPFYIPSNGWTTL